MTIFRNTMESLRRFKPFIQVALQYQRSAVHRPSARRCRCTSPCAQDLSDRSAQSDTQGDCTEHVPVMVSEVLERLQPQNHHRILDMTFGAGGHTRAIFSHAPQCRVFGLDRDPRSNKLAQEFASENPRFTPLSGRFSEVHHLLAPHGITQNSLDGVLFDVGASSMQFDEADRGFSVVKDGPLDMRMDGDRCPSAPTAAEVINYLDASDIYCVLRRYGEERLARPIARAIVDSRYTFGPVTRTRQLADIVASVYNMSHGLDKLQRSAHVATRTFQALRIFVNNELNELYNGLTLAHHLLRPGGICVVICFHSLEDRIAKRHFHGIDMEQKANMSVTDQHRNNLKTYGREELKELLHVKWEPLARKVILPSEEEEAANPRCRSAKLRAAYKLDH